MLVWPINTAVCQCALQCVEDYTMECPEALIFHFLLVKPRTNIMDAVNRVILGKMSVGFLGHASTAKGLTTGTGRLLVASRLEN